MCLNRGFGLLYRLLPLRVRWPMAHPQDADFIKEIEWNGHKGQVEDVRRFIKPIRPNIIMTRGNSKMNPNPKIAIVNTVLT
jgi:hypothetical protein